MFAQYRWGIINVAQMHNTLSIKANPEKLSNFAGLAFHSTVIPATPDCELSQGGRHLPLSSVFPGASTEKVPGPNLSTQRQRGLAHQAGGGDVWLSNGPKEVRKDISSESSMAGGQEGDREDRASQFIKGKKGGGSQHAPNISGRTHGAWSLPMVGTEGRAAGGVGVGGGTACAVFRPAKPVSEERAGVAAQDIFPQTFSVVDTARER